MTWYKTAQAFKPQSLGDRNLINEKIRYFEDVCVKLDKLSKVIFQDGVFAKQASFNLSLDKKLSSHPSIQEILIQADKIALDNPWKFAALCLDACDAITLKITELKRQRKELTEKTLPNKMKGWVDKHGR